MANERGFAEDDVITEVNFDVGVSSLPIHHQKHFGRFIGKMRVYGRLLATMEEGAATTNLRRTPMALLPPIPLYRRILRSHRKKLPVEERTLGDLYVKSEFKLHKNIDNPVQIVSH